MRVPLEWLREYCAPALDVDAIEERLTMTGTKVEAVHHHGVGNPDRFVVGRVVAAEPHPDADRLRVCRVDLGMANDDGEATIVCGAPNVAGGQLVAVALPGAVMPGGAPIERRKLRGVASEGMICAASELALAGDGDGGGILVLDELTLDAEPEIGAPLAQLLPISTAVLELEVTSNRPDCLGVYGVARELHAATGAALAPEPWHEDEGSSGELPIELARVTVECPDLCPRFSARVFEGVAIGPSPPWLAARLLAAGQRPINNVVDITNYVMLLTAQPLHAFDLDRVSGGHLTVRRAHDGEQVQTLDGQTRTLDAETVVIADDEGPTSIAGLMGGARSEVGPETARVLLEVANWNGPNIHRASWSLGLRSEASARFEKGLAPEQCVWAQAVATQLMIALCRARVAPGTIDVGGDGPPSRPIRLRDARVREILGIEIAVTRQEEILHALDFHAEPAGDGLDVRPPPVRREDVTREADLIEEVARIDGLEKLPATLPKRRGAYGVLSPEQRLRRRALDALVGRGLYESVGWTFASPALADRLRLADDDPRRMAPVVENPLSEEQSRLRTMLLGSLLDTAAHNVSRGLADLRLFEVGTVFALTPDGARANAPDASGARGETGVAERRSLGVLLSGRLDEPSWRVAEPAMADFFAAKAMLEALTRALRVDGLALAPARQPFLHTARTADVQVGGESIGWIGELHPLVAQAWELPGASCLELDLDRLIAHAQARRAYEDLIGYPPLRRDLAVVMPAGVPAAEVLAAAREAAGELLRDVRVFDVYTGQQLGPGRRSLALALSFRASDRTLSDDDVAPASERIVAALARLGGELRA
ncbi:MAG TPA: phenylalanine--tRNA ligase subunit beta [Solirubrobacteraceae bacterium]|nr:phenylalanine--tRNA ligase subunit beta [Solirubrobacteraceae bacterium]